MKTMTVRGTSVAAGANSGNVLVGKLFEFLERPSIIRWYPVGSAVGLQITANVGGEVFIQGEEISGANRFPTRDQDFLGEGVGGFNGFILRRRTQHWVFCLLHGSVRMPNL